MPVAFQKYLRAQYFQKQSEFLVKGKGDENFGVLEFSKRDLSKFEMICWMGTVILKYEKDNKFGLV